MAYEFVRPRYKDFIDFEVDNIDIWKANNYVRSTDTKRTIETAKLMVGTLFNHIDVDEMAKEFKIERLKKDQLLHLGEKNC